MEASDRVAANRQESLFSLRFWRDQYEGRIYVPDHWALHFSPCCEYHRVRVHVGPFIWRWSA